MRFAHSLTILSGALKSVVSTIYNTIAENLNSTVVAEYVSENKSANQYQSENELEQDFIRLLQGNGYEFLNISSNDDLLQNLRVQLSKVNDDMVFSELEWQRILDGYLTKKYEGIEEKTAKVHEDDVYNLKRDDGSTKNVRILHKRSIHKNSVQVINQYEAEGLRKNRYDVTILINGLQSCMWN